MNDITPPRTERPTRRITIELPLAMAERIEATWRDRAITKSERVRALLAKGLEAEGQS